jgi:hypothetical protein
MSSIPVSYVKFTNKTKPWVTPVLLDLINKRWSAFRSNNFSLYNHYKAKVREEINKSKKIWSSKMCRSPKGVWAVVNDARGKTNKSSADQIASLFLDSSDAAESINALFAKSFVKSSPFPLFPTDNETIHDICNEELVFSLLHSLKTDKSPGSDGIYPLLLKVSASALCKPLSYIFNLSFSLGTVPNAWKLAHVCPIPKVTPITRDKFRPISLLPVISKVMEKVILRQYRKEFVSCYDHVQFAYRPLSSTVCALIYFHDIVLKYLEMPDVAALRILCFDMTHAFDCVPHDLLLSCLFKLPLHNVKTFVNWLNSYLYNRRQQVKLGSTKSSVVEVTSGVPQGSLLGPYMFALYMSTYEPVNSNVKMVKYADDITLVIPVYKRDFDDLCTTSLEVQMFRSWCDNNKMRINHDKTQVMHVNFSNSPMLSLRDCDTVTHIKILGLIFNCKLTWSNHFDYIITCISRRLYVLRILRNVLTHDQLIIVYNSIVRSLLDYASPVFLNPGCVQNARLEKICKRAFKIIHGLDVRNCVKCSFLELHQRRRDLALRLFRKALNDSNHVLHSILPKTSHRSRRLLLPHVTSSRRLNGFVISCTMLHNESL